MFLHADNQDSQSDQTRRSESLMGTHLILLVLLFSGSNVSCSLTAAAWQDVESINIDFLLQHMLNTSNIES